MEIRFKFRSSVGYDSLEIGERASISVKELKSKIIQKKNLINAGSDLVLSDAVSGQEYDDENIQVPSGSSVMIKRVPAGTAHANVVNVDSFGASRVKEGYANKTSLPAKWEVVDALDDFGDDICAATKAKFSGSHPEYNKKICASNDKMDSEALRCPEPIANDQKNEGSEIIEAIYRGSAVNDNEEKKMPTVSKPIPAEEKKSEKLLIANPLAAQSFDLPSELKCPICSAFFQEAVMIRCCQQSFCEKCIRISLSQESRCPKCLSTRCRAEDLLPNVSLRQAIERLVDCQILIYDSDNALHRYAPDGESAIGANEVSGSNQVIADKSTKKARLPHKKVAEGYHSTNPVYLKEKIDGAADLADFQGETQPLVEEAESIVNKKRAFPITTAGEDKGLMDSRRNKKGERTCYMCGSPNHFIRHCPMASRPHPMPQTGSQLPYWNGATLSHLGAFMNISTNHWMMPYNASMPPVPPVSRPMYLPPIYAGTPGYRGLTRFENTAPPFGSDAGYMNIQHYGDPKPLNEISRREHFADGKSDDYCQRHQDMDEERSQCPGSYDDREMSASYSGDSRSRRSKRKCQQEYQPNERIDSADQRHRRFHSSISGRDRESRDKREHYHSENSKPELEGIPSSFEWYQGERHRHYGRNSKKDTGMEHQSHSGSSFERSLSGNQQRGRELESSHGSKHSRHELKSLNNDWSDERKKPFRGLGKDQQDYQHHKRKRVH